MGQSSDYKRQSNQRNAQKSTGPTSEVGKSIACRNSLKHGFTARKLTPGESLVDTEEAMRLWVGDLNPQSQHALALAEASFECKLRLDEVSRAHWSRIAIRARDAERKFEDKVNARNQRLRKAYREDRVANYAQYRNSYGGVIYFEEMVEHLQNRLDTNQWGEEENGYLMDLDGLHGEPTEPILAMHLKCFDTRKKLYACYESACKTSGAQCELAQAARFSIEMQEEEFKAAKAYIKTRLDDRMATLQREHDEWDETFDLQKGLLVDAAKFDPRRSGVLLERYLRDRLRDFVKTTHEAIAACAPPKPGRGDVKASASLDCPPAPASAPEPEKSAEPPPETRVEPPPLPSLPAAWISRNEPNNAYSDDAGCDVVLPFTAALPTAPDPVDER